MLAGSSTNTDTQCQREQQAVS